MQLPLQADIDGGDHLLDRRKAIGAMGARIARPIEDIALRVVDCGHALEDLLIGDGIDELAVLRERT